MREAKGPRERALFVVEPSALLGPHAEGDVPGLDGLPDLLWRGYPSDPQSDVAEFNVRVLDNRWDRHLAKLSKVQGQIVDRISEVAKDFLRIRDYLRVNQ